MHVGESVYLHTKLDTNGESLTIRGELLTINDYGVRINRDARTAAGEVVYFIPWGSIDYIKEGR